VKLLIAGVARADTFFRRWRLRKEWLSRGIGREVVLWEHNAGLK